MAETQVEAVPPAEEKKEVVGVDEEEEPDFSKKHPLEHRWTLWFDNKQRGKGGRDSWGATLNTVYSFGTVEEFWCLYNNIQTPGKLAANADLHLFKEGIKPAWEDPANENGGSWTLIVPKSPEAKNQLDNWWLDLLLCVIGEQFEGSEDICGVSANVRQRQDRITMWTKTAANEAAQVSLGKQIRHSLSLPESVTLGYIFHDDVKRDQKAKDRYTV
eukprot:TRINITY_DN4936_c0_g1_i1.p2 TRINITY_DN4936_c0_g1~~TRINITY_DN4936_c0_g1_i1.p2  ORF type:complete len:216 (-),score=51.88 TRINITY_DN4936_c0_g1_i1:229-876(-)